MTPHTSMPKIMYAVHRGSNWDLAEAIHLQASFHDGVDTVVVVVVVVVVVGLFVTSGLMHHSAYGMVSRNSGTVKSHIQT